LACFIEFGGVVPKEQGRLSLLWVGAKGIVRTIARLNWAIEMITCAEQVDIGEFDEACVAMAAAAETSVNCCCIADALVVCQFKALVGRLADDGVKALEHESCFDVFEARGLGSHGEVYKKLVRTAELRLRAIELLIRFLLIYGCLEGDGTRLGLKPVCKCPVAHPVTVHV
jgi:hypothetical protein